MDLGESVDYDRNLRSDLEGDQRYIGDLEAHGFSGVDEQGELTDLEGQDEEFYDDDESYDDSDFDE